MDGGFLGFRFQVCVYSGSGKTFRDAKGFHYFREWFE